MPRQPGTPNKITKTIREAILEAFDRVGGPAYLEKLAMDDPRTFGTLLGKVIPQQLEHSGPGGGPIHVISAVPQPGESGDADR